MDHQKKKSIIEALIFVSGNNPLTAKEIQKITDFSIENIYQLISELISDYKARGSGIQIVEVAQGYQMVTAPELITWIKKIKKIPKLKLSQAAIETLAIIAYKQPITKAEIEKLRGVAIDGVLKSLLEKHLIKIVGKKNTHGKPILYGTTKEFLLQFGLKDISDLPDIEELDFKL